MEESQGETATAYFPEQMWEYHPSYGKDQFAHVIESGQFFVMRCTDDKTEKILGFPLDNIQQLDHHVERILSRSQSKKK